VGRKPSFAIFGNFPSTAMGVTARISGFGGAEVCSKLNMLFRVGQARRWIWAGRLRLCLQ
jgi:hypothetical protein